MFHLFLSPSNNKQDPDRDTAEPQEVGRSASQTENQGQGQGHKTPDKLDQGEGARGQRDTLHGSNSCEIPSDSISTSGTPDWTTSSKESFLLENSDQSQSSTPDHMNDSSQSGSQMHRSPSRDSFSPDHMDAQKVDSKSGESESRPMSAVSQQSVKLEMSDVGEG